MTEECLTKWPVSFYRTANGDRKNDGTIACYLTEFDGADHEFQFLHFGKREQDYQCRECKNMGRRNLQSTANTSLKIIRTSDNPLGYFQADPKTLSHICTTDESGNRIIIRF